MPPNPARSRNLVTFVLAATLSSVAWPGAVNAQDVAAEPKEIGTVVYVEGAPAVYRDGQEMNEPADFGFPVESYDFFRTGELDLLEIETDPAVGADARIVVQPESALYLDMTVLRGRGEESASGAENGRGEQQGVGIVELVHGSLEVAVSRLTADAAFEVKTDSTTMGVRGTRFVVDIAVTGDVLISADEGRVEVRDGAGSVLFAEPGRVVERTDDRRFRNIPVDVSNLSSFRREWAAVRLEQLREDPLRVLRAQARRYLDAREQLGTVYRGVMRRRNILEEWIDNDRRLRREDPSRLRERRERVAPALRRAIPVLRHYERLYYRLQRLAPVLQRIGIDPELRVTEDMTVGEFFDLLDGDSAVFERRMHFLRYSLKLFVLRNAGALPD
jgi:hypothetical protein